MHYLVEILEADPCDLLPESGEHNEVVHGDVCNLRVIADRKGGSTGGTLVARMHGSITQTAFFWTRVFRGVPVFWVVLAIWPVASILAVV